ncbi:transcriptional regulator [Spirochaetia bacterium]|nr:transcriptional regulator [Spirochaetia bacterium]
MNEQEILKIISGGECSKVQFKERLPHIDNLAHEIIAFSNSQGGLIIFGINDKTGKINGLSFGEIREINQQLVNAASQKIYPPVYLTTETIHVDNEALVVARIEEGTGKPYKDASGIIYTKNGSDKRKITSNNELARLLGSGGFLSADEMSVLGSSIEDIDLDQFNSFLLKKYKKTLDDLNVKMEKILENLGLSRDGVLTLTGLLLFSKKRHKFRPQFSIQCVSVDGSVIGNKYTDNEGVFEGTLEEIFQRTMDFIGRNMKKIPESNGFNSLSKWEIPYEVFEELIVNALVHRDYFVSSTIKVFVFSDRIEIVSPGRLPNSLTIENVKNGVSIARNPILLSAVQFVLPYKGLGTGILRAYSLYPEIFMENRVEENQFKIIMKRRAGESR